MKILITGRAGFIGSHIQDELIEQGHQVAVVDNLSTGDQNFINAKSHLFKQDTTEFDKLDKTFQDFFPEVVFHLAAQAAVPFSMSHPTEDNKINIIGTMNVLEAARKVGVKKFIYSNTGGALYGDVPPSDLPIREDHIISSPTSFYGVSKLCAEYYVKLYGHIYNLPWVTLRYANVFGPRQAKSKEVGVVAIFITLMLEGKTPTINGDGSHTRDYVYIEDVVRANIKAMSYEKSDYFNISTGIETSNRAVFDTINELVGKNMTPQFGPERTGDAKRVSLNSQKAADLLNWKAEVDFKSGVKKTIDFYSPKSS